MKKQLTDKEINDYIEKINVCYSHFRQWGKRKAQKNHIDLFGEEIKSGEHYYRLSLDGNYSNDIKLSEANMNKFLYALFAPYPSWLNDAEKEIKSRVEKLREIINEHEI